MSNNTDSDLPSSMEENVKLGFYIASLIIGFGGNSLVIVVIAGKKHKRSIYDLLILNLGISDLIFIIVSMPINIYSYFRVIYQNSHYCQLLIPLLTIFYFLSIFTITSMAVHRCRLITNPYKLKMKKRIAYIWIALIYFSSFIIVLPLSIVGKAEGGFCLEDWPSLNYRKAYTLALSILQFVLPLLIIAVAYVRIGIYLWRSNRSSKLFTRNKEEKSTEEKKRKHSSNQDACHNCDPVRNLFTSRTNRLAFA